MPFCDICKDENICIYVKAHNKHLCNVCAGWYIAFLKLDKLLKIFQKTLKNQMSKFELIRGINIAENDTYWLKDKP